jgi:phosphoribosylamine--glycine ligase
MLAGVTVLHAGTGLDEQGRPVTAGGRVLGVCGSGPSTAEARARAYAGVGAISWDGVQYRTDIAAAGRGGAGIGEASA